MVDFDTYVREHGAALLRFAYLVTGNREKAEDAVQEALSRAWPRWERISQVGDVDAYVRRMVANAHISSWRKWHRETPVETVRDQAFGGDVGDRGAEHDRMWALLATLPRKQRAALVLRHYEGLSDKEIAAVLGSSDVTVRTNIHRALVTLRGRLGEED